MLLGFFVCKQGLKRKAMAFWGFLSSITRVNLAHIAKHQTPFINQAATKPAVPGEEGDVLKSAWLCFILLPSLEQKQRLTVQSRLALMCHTRCSPSRLPTQQDSRSPGCRLLLSGNREQSSLRVQPGFDLGIKSLRCISSFPGPCCSP